MIKRLKIKFVCVNMVIVTVMLLIIFGMVLHFTEKGMEEQGGRILQTLHTLPENGNRGPMERRVPFFVVMVSPRGDLSVTADASLGLNMEEQLPEILLAVQKNGGEKGILKGHDLRFSRRKIPAGEELVFMDISMEQGMMDQLIKNCIMIGLVSYGLFFGISILLAQWAIRPVEKAWQRQHQFVADASHELKTPLTVILTNAELLQNDDDPNQSKNQFADNILAMSHQMRGLVEGMLDLARVDNGVVRKTFSELDFTKLMERFILPFEPAFFENGMELELQLEPDIMIWGSETHLRQVVEILLDNALKYGNAEKPVQIKLWKQGRVARFLVSTSGEELSGEDLKNIFKRFYRVDKVRTLSKSHGLGLAIAEGIIGDHNGKIWAESGQGRNTFHVQIPSIQS